MSTYMAKVARDLSELLDDGYCDNTQSPQLDELARHIEAQDATIAELLSIVQRFVALPSGAWYPERHAHEEAELMADAAIVMAKAEDR